MIEYLFQRWWWKSRLSECLVARSLAELISFRVISQLIEDRWSSIRSQGCGENLQNLGYLQNLNANKFQISCNACSYAIVRPNVKF